MSDAERPVGSLVQGCGERHKQRHSDDDNELGKFVKENKKFNGTVLFVRNFRIMDRHR